jgi:hypothetical protein
VNEVAVATLADLKYVKQIFVGTKTSSPEVLDEIIDAFALRVAAYGATRSARSSGSRTSNEHPGWERSAGTVECRKLRQAARCRRTGQVGQLGRRARRTRRIMAGRVARMGFEPMTFSLKAMRSLEAT